MISLQQIEELVVNTPEDKIKKIIDYLNGKTPSQISPIIMQDVCKLTSSQTDVLKKICEQTDDGNLLSVTINAVSQMHEQTGDEISRLVMSGDFIHKNTDFTDETIHYMIGRAKSKITIIGYWVFKMDELFERLNELSRNIEITFILNDEKIEEHSQEIKQNWNNRTKPKIYQLNRKLYPKGKLNKLHSKVIIIDDKEILITSANLTFTAMNENIETGVWTKDKKIIRACIEIFEKFIEKQVFVPISEKKY
jgi:hypothetical protein